MVMMGKKQLIYMIPTSTTFQRTIMMKIVMGKYPQSHVIYI